MDIKAFVKDDFKKLCNPKTLKNMAFVGGGLLALLNMVNDKNDRESMKNDVVKEVMEQLSSGEKES